MRNIYVLGPPGIGKSTFIAKYFDPLVAKNSVVEQSVPEMPERYLTVFIYLPLSFEETKKRSNISEIEYNQWLDFYTYHISNPKVKLVRNA
jgi:GTPase SAR1 family protein